MKDRITVNTATQCIIVKGALGQQQFEIQINNLAHSFPEGF